MNTTGIHLSKLIDNAINQAEIEFNARMEQIHKEQLAKKDKEIERLHNIIKDAREYIENNTLYSEDYDYDEEDNLKWNGAYDYKAREELLEILDKENDK